MEYDPVKGKAYYNKYEYDIYTGKELDERIYHIIKFAEGEISLQDLYLELLLHDKELVKG